MGIDDRLYTLLPTSDKCRFDPQEGPVGLGSTRFSNFVAAIGVVMLVVGLYAEPTKLNALWWNVLTYQTSGLECASDGCSLEVRISNNGWVTQRDLRFELPTLYRKEHTRIFSSKGYTLSKVANVTIMDLGLVHPGKDHLVVLYYPKGAAPEKDLERFHLSIYSADAYAVYAGPDDPFALPWWWWWLVYIITASAVLSTLARIFESKKDRYIRLLRERAAALKGVSRRQAKIERLNREIAEVPPDIVDQAERTMDKWPRFMVPESRRGSKPSA